MTSPRALNLFQRRDDRLSGAERLFNAAMKNREEFLKILDEPEFLKLLGKNDARRNQLNGDDYNSWVNPGLDQVGYNAALQMLQTRAQHIADGGYLFDLCKYHQDSLQLNLEAQKESLQKYLSESFFVQLFPPQYVRKF